MKRALIIGSVAAVCFLALTLLELYQPFAYLRVRNLYRDALTRAGATTPPNPDLVFLAIDSDSVGLEETADIKELYGLTDSNTEEAHALRLMSKLWPWPREVYGLVLERLARAGARVIIFDLTFPTSTEGDEPFRLALDRYKDRVVIGSNFVSASSRGFSTLGTSHTRPPETLIPQTSPIDDRVAYTNFWPDEDDVVRRAQYRVTFEEVQGNKSQPESEQFLSLAARGLTKAGFGNVVPPGLSSRLIRFTAPPRQGFSPHSIFEIFVPDYWKHNYQDGEFFRGKTVLIGAEGNWQHDEHPTPFGAMPGPEIHLNAINAALHGSFIRELSPVVAALLTALAGLIAIALSLLVRSPWLRIVGVFALNGAGVVLALFVFNRASTFLPMVAPLAQLNLTVFLGLISDLTWERIEKNRFRRTLEKYVSKNVVRELLDHPKLFAQALGGVVKPATILFSDIRGYSSVTARSDPQALVAQLNEYLTAMVECVFRFGGTLDKFIGDAVMAVWGNTRSEGVRDDAANAVRAALAMRQELARLNESWAARGLPPLRIGVAVNHGEVVVGNIGSPQRMEFTVIGDAVNISWKLQELTKELDAELIVGENVMTLVIEEFEMRPLGAARIKGVPQPLEIFEVLGAIEPESANLSAAALL
ncbi:MAG: adenylate cyclase [Verrucomicrobiota bacterium]|jgi:adenylate cyclase